MLLLASLGLSVPALAAEGTATTDTKATTGKATASTKATAGKATTSTKATAGKATTSTKTTTGKATASTKATAGKATTGAKKTAEAKTTAPRLSVEQVMSKHLSARGGQQAWKGVQALLLTGRMEAGTGDSVARSMRAARAPGAGTQAARREIAMSAHKAQPDKQVQLPFKLAKQLPNRSRLEIEFAGKTAVQVYDGTNGWKLRPFLNRTDVKPFTPEEAKAEAALGGDLGDPLIDSQAKGTKVALEGVEPVEGRAAYKLRLTTKAGAVQHVWIDARSFLDVKVEGTPRRMDGKLHTVWVVQRDFRTVQGLKIPFAQETVVEGFPQTHKILVDKVVVNPKLDPSTFAKPTA